MCLFRVDFSRRLESWFVFYRSLINLLLFPCFRQTHYIRKVLTGLYTIYTNRACVLFRSLSEFIALRRKWSVIMLKVHGFYMCMYTFLILHGIKNVKWRMVLCRCSLIDPDYLSLYFHVFCPPSHWCPPLLPKFVRKATDPHIWWQILMFPCLLIDFYPR